MLNNLNDLTPHLVVTKSLKKIWAFFFFFTPKGMISILPMRNLYPISEAKHSRSYKLKLLFCDRVCRVRSFQFIKLIRIAWQNDRAFGNWTAAWGEVLARSKSTVCRKETQKLQRKQGSGSQTLISLRFVVRGPPASRPPRCTARPRDPARIQPD